MADRELELECAALCRHLGGREPPPPLVAKYVEAHALGVVERRERDTAFDRALVAVARRGGLLASAADVHARFFRPAGLLRRKLVLALALLESHGDTVDRVDRPSAIRPGAFVLAMVARMAWSGVVLLVGLLVFLPLRAASALRPGASA